MVGVHAGRMLTLLVQAEDSDAEDQISRVDQPTNSAHLPSPSDIGFIGSVRS